MTIQSNFQPQYGSGQTFSPAAGSAQITIGKGARTLRVKNTGATNVMQFRTGNSANGTITATAADFQLSPGEVAYIAKPPEHDTLASISASGTTAHVIAGEGGMGSGN